MNPPNTNKIINPELWLDKYGDDLFAWAYHRTGKRALAEDLVQETFLSALKSMKNFRGDSNEKTWLFSILRNKIIDHYRKAFVKYEMEESRLETNASNGSFLEKYFDSSGSWNKNQRPGNWHEEENHLLDDSDFQDVLKMCLSSLPGKWHSLISFKYMEEKRTSEICKELNITSSNLWVIMHRAKLQLRRCIEENYLADGE
jgi:RNA polymerase sigma-70 factor (ECF subfamily)